MADLLAEASDGESIEGPGRDEKDVKVWERYVGKVVSREEEEMKEDSTMLEQAERNNKVNETEWEKN